MKRLIAVLVAVAFVEPALFACPVCFQLDDNATTHGIRAAVTVLLAVTTVVLGAFGVFVTRFAARERSLKFEVQSSKF